MSLTCSYCNHTMTASDASSHSKCHGKGSQGTSSHTDSIQKNSQTTSTLESVKKTFLIISTAWFRTSIFFVPTFFYFRIKESCLRLSQALSFAEFRVQLKVAGGVAERLAAARRGSIEGEHIIGEEH